MHKNLLAEIQRQFQLDANKPPMVSLDLYFQGNNEEDSIAPNQCGEGRPSISEIYERFKAIALKPEVQLILVSIHDDWETSQDDDVWPPGDNVHIYTTASRSEVENWIEGLQADGAISGWPRGKHPSAPEPQKGFKLFSVVWD